MSEKELLRCAFDLISAIEKNAGLPALINMAVGTGMSHIGYAYFKNELANSLSGNLHAAAPDMLEALEIQHQCGIPEKVSLYDEEAIEGWRWTHPDGREWTAIGDWNETPPLHPVARAAIAKAKGGAQ